MALRRWGVLVLASLAKADYYIDDTNVTLTYSSGPKAAWAPYAVDAETLELLLPNGTYQTINASVCYDRTYRYAACFATDTCLLTIPFSGSGITVYVYQAGPVGINASITVDGAHNQTNVLSAAPAPNYQIANVSMFNIQQLPSGPHSLNLLINDFDESYSGMMFDYAYVNESLVASPATTSTTTLSTTTLNTASSTPSSSPPSESRIDVAPIVGGVVALVFAITASVLLFLWIRRRRGPKHPEMIDLHSDNPFSSFNSNSLYDPPFPKTHPRSPKLASLMPLVPNRLGPSGVERAPTPSSSGPDGLYPTSPSSRSGSPSGAAERQTRRAVSNDTTTSRHHDVSPLLTDEQADFINSLHRNNVPAAAIARVMERMLADRHAGIREWERETRLARSNTMTTAPPSYDLVAGE